MTPRRLTVFVQRTLIALLTATTTATATAASATSASTTTAVAIIRLRLADASFWRRQIVMMMHIRQGGIKTGAVLRRTAFTSLKKNQNQTHKMTAK